MSSESTHQKGSKPSDLTVRKHLLAEVYRHPVIVATAFVPLVGAGVLLGMSIVS